MKKLFLVIGLFAFIFSANAQVDITKKPESLGETTFKFPDYVLTTLSNGLKVFIVEDHEQPTINFRLLIPGGSSLDGEKSGLAEVLSDMLSKGAGSRNALQFAQTADGIGANLGASAGIDYLTVSGSGLKRHMPVILELMSDMILKPTFTKDEFDKLIPLMLAGLQDEKSKPMSVAGRLIRKIMYGEHHPYGKKETEASLKSITIEDVKEYFNKYLKPNNASIVVIGDITQKEITDKLEKAFSAWKTGEVPKIIMPKTEQMPIGVYFIRRPSSVQSTICLVTKGLPVNSDDYYSLSLASSLIGSGFGGRLFRTLREKYSYTYTPFGSHGNNKYANNFVCGADVRNSVTDSSLDVIIEQMKLMATEPASEEELGRIKKFEIGEYQMSFENAGFTGSLLQTADFNGIPLEKIKAYPDIIASINPYQVQKISSKYINPDGAWIVVVGSPAIKEKLERFGKIYEYDLDLNPLSGENAKMEKVSLSAKELIQNYTKAIGGKEVLAKVRTLTTEGTANLTIQGNAMTGKIKSLQKSPNKKFQSIEIGMINQKIWSDGTNVWAESNGALEKKEGDELQKSLNSFRMFKETELLEIASKCEVLGKQKNEILMKVTNKNGDEEIYYYDANTFLLNKVETSETTPRGPMPVTMSFSNYEKVEGITLPKKLETMFPMFTIKVDNTYNVNAQIDDTIFSPSKKN